MTIECLEPTEYGQIEKQNWLWMVLKLVHTYKINLSTSHTIVVFLCI